MLLVLVVASTVAQIPTAPPAGAALSNLFPADHDGFPKGRFFSDEALYVTLTSDFEGGVVCIVPAYVTVPSSADCVGDIAWGTPRKFTGLGTLLGFPLKAPWLTAGEWRLLTVPKLTAKDAYGNERPVPGTELSEVFVVEKCGPCDRSWADNELQPWKDMAGRMKTLGTLAQAAETYDTASKVYKVAAGMYAGVGFGMSGVILGGLGAGGALWWDSVKPKGTEDRAKDLFKGLANRVGAMYADIHADPPRFDYDVTTVPQFETVAPLAPDASMSPGEVDLANSYFEAMERAAAYGDASRVANERYQGAVIDGDHEAAHLQALAASTFTFQMNQQLRLVQLYETQVITQSWATETNITLPDGETWAAVLAEIDELVANGLSVDQQAALDAELAACTIKNPHDECLITQDVVDRARAAWADPTWVAALHAVDPDRTLADVMAANSAQLDDAIAAFDHFGQWMAHNAADEEDQIPTTPPNRAPNSSFEASALTGTAPLTVTFTSTATDPDGDALGLRWDIGGSRIVDDAASVTHTFTTPGTYGVSLVATDPSGEWDQAIKWITVYPDTGVPPGDNQPPVASFSPQWVDKEGPFTQTFTASSFDPDGDALTHTWYFGDGTTATGKTVTKTFPPGFIMSVLLVSSDGTLTGQVAGEVTSRHPGVDPTPNAPPVASFTADPSSGASPLEVTFTSTSTDPDGDPLTHTWHFGDGATATGATATHTYTHAGTYTATLVVSDGTNSISTTRTVVASAYGAIEAGFTVSDGYDAAAAGNGARIVDNGVSQQATRPVTNIQLPGVGGANEWWTASGVTGDAEVIVHLAGNGSDLLDEVVLEGVPATTSAKTFSVGLSSGADPFGSYDTVIDHATLAASRDAQSYGFAPRTGRFLKLTVHDNHGGAYVSLGRLRAMTVDREGGIVSLNTGLPATIVSATSEYSTTYSAESILEGGTSYWSSAIDHKSDQRIVVKLGGEGPHEIASVALRNQAATNAVTNVEVWTSLTGDDGDWTKAAEAGLAETVGLQTVPVSPAVEANFVELRLSGTGSGRYLRVAEVQLVTTHGLNVARGAGVGAQVVDVSSEASTRYLAEKAIAPDTVTDYWSTASGQVTDQFMTVLLRNGDVATIDRATVTSAGNRPRDVKIQTSIDGVTYTTQATRRLGNVSEVHEVRFAPTPARFVKLVVDDGYSTSSIRVDQFRVYAVDRGGATVTFVDTSVGSAPATAWAWDFGDGTTSTDRHPTHTFSAAGTYPVTLTVSDADGNTDTVTRPYTVAGAPVTPSALTITAGTPAVLQGDGSYTIAEGTWTTLTAGNVDGAVVGWQWDLPRPTTTTGATVSTYFPDDGTFLVRVRALTADLLWTPWQTRTFVVSNAPPAVNAGPDIAGLAGDELRVLYSSVSDPAGVNDSLTCTWDWGDGTPVDTVTDCTAATSRLGHTFAAAGTYTATLTVDDGEGGVTSDTTTFTVALRPTTLQIVSAIPAGGDLVVTAHLLDGMTGAPVVGADLTVTADGAAPSTATTEPTGRVTVTVPGASGATDVGASYGGSPARESKHVTRPVRAPKADIVFIIDESASMGGVQDRVVENLRTIIGGLTSTLDFRVGTVGYAAGDINGFGRVRMPLTNDLTDVYEGLRRHGNPSWSANGYEGIVVGSGFTYDPDSGELIDTGAIGHRPPAASCAVLITDAGVSEAGEDANKNGPLADYDAALEALQRRNTTLFSIIATNHAPTAAAYGTGPGGLAAVTGGDQWSIGAFSNDPSGVLDALAAKCATKAATPDLAVSIDGPSAPVAAADEVTYTVTARNVAAIDVPAVTLTATLPGDVEYLYSAGGGVFDAATRTVTWSTFDLAAGDELARDITVRVRSHEWDAGDHPLVAGATVSYDGSLGAESDPTNNTASHTLTVHVPEPIGPSTTSSTVPEEPTTTTSSTVPDEPTPTSVPSTVTPTTSSSTTVPDELTTTSSLAASKGTVVASSVPPAAAIQPSRIGPVADPAARELPRTGPDRPILPPAGLGLLLMLLGAAIVLQARRRTRPS